MARKMKDSGIEWIGEIPEWWSKNKCLRLFNVIGSGTTPKSLVSDESPSINWIQSGDINGTLLFSCKNTISESTFSQYSALKTYSAPFIIIAMYGASIGNISISFIDGCVNQACCVLSVPLCNLDYAFYAIKSAQFYLVQKAVGGGQPNISQDTIKQLWIPQPSLAMQEAIANSLNKACSHIDAILTKTRTSIEEYKKLKQAVITQAVTKGVRGEREMKDSGVEWIGEINHRFSLIKLKYICSILDQYRKPISADKRSQSGSILYDYYGASGAIDKIDDYTIDDHVMLIGEDGANLRMRNLPLMYEVNGKAWINNHAHILKPTERVDFYYLFYALEELDINPYITGSAQPKLSQEKLQNIWVPLPDLEEQQEIATYIRSKCAEIDKLVVKKEQLVKELESYKKSLIYEVVTGKREIFTDITRKFPNI